MNAHTGVQTCDIVPECDSRKAQAEGSCLETGVLGPPEDEREIRKNEALIVANATIREPWLSIIVVVHDMPLQAENTLFSLLASYQQEVASEEYEVIVVENESERMLDKRGRAGSRRCPGARR